METTRREEQVNELSIGSNTPKVVVEDGLYEVELTNFKVGNEMSKWGPKQFAKLNFKITKGQYANVSVTYKGNFFQDQASGQWVIGPKSKLAEAIKAVTGGTVTLNRGHIGSRAFVKVKTFTSQTSGERYSLVEMVMTMPRDYQTPPTAAPVQGAAPAVAPAGQNGPAQPAPRPAQPAPAPQAQPKPAGNANLLDDLTELSDYTLQ